MMTFDNTPMKKKKGIRILINLHQTIFQFEIKKHVYHPYPISTPSNAGSKS